MLSVRGTLLLVALAGPAHAQNPFCSTCALNTCDGVMFKLYDLVSKCPGSMEGRAATGPKTPASCGSDACKAVITSIDDNALSSIKAGFSATGCENVVDNYVFFSYEYLKTLARECGHAASTVKVTPPAGASLAWLLLYKFL